MPAYPLQHSDRLSRQSTALVKVALVAVFTAVSLGSYYPMGSLANVKLTDSIDFIVTYIFGLQIGLATTILTRTIFASFNPWGVAPITLIPVLVLGDCFYPLAAYLTSRARLAEGFTGRSLTLGIAGFLSTLGFDLLTNFASGLISVTGPDTRTYVTRAFLWGIITMNFPVPLGIIHEVSNFLFFSTVAPVAILIIKRSALSQYTLLPGFARPRNGKR